MKQPLTDEQVEDIQRKLVDRFEAARVLSVQDVAHLWGVHPRTVGRVIDAGKVAHVRVGKRLGVMQSDAIQYLLRHRYAGQSQAS